MIRVVIVDDHPAVRTGVREYLDAEGGVSVEAALATVADAAAACERLRPDVLVADYHLPDGDGLTLCLRLLDAGGPPVVLFSAFADEYLHVLAAVAGARAVVQKSADPQDLIAAVRAVAGGERPLTAPSPPALRQAGGRLDGDDLPVLGMLVHGVGTDEIAGTLSISRDSLTARRRAMFERLSGGPLRRSSRPWMRRRVPSL